MKNTLADGSGGTILVLASSFLDRLTALPADADEGRSLLSMFEARHEGRFRVRYQCKRDSSRTPTPEELRGVVAIIADLEPYPAALLARVGVRAGGTLRLIARYGVGHDSIDLAAASECGVAVTNTPGAASLATAEWTLATMVDVAGRRIAQYARAFVGKPKRGRPRLDLFAKSVGLVGAGSVARALARLLAGFRAHILVADPVIDRDWAAEIGADWVGLDELCARADFISLHASAGEQIIGARQIELMRPATVLINCARRHLVDNRAVWRAVDEGQLWGYGMDDSWIEDDLDLRGRNIIVSPHVGSDSESGMLNMRMQTAQQVCDFLDNKLPGPLLNPDYASAAPRRAGSL